VTDLTGRTVVVVGAGGALGGGIVSAFVASGARVVGLDRALPKPEHQVAGVDYHPVDVLDDAALGSAFDELGTVWAVANVVGGYAGSRPFAELDAAELTAQLNLNLVSAALVTKHALRLMTAAGEGRIVHTASRVALATAGTGFPYSVSKAGVLHLVRMAAEQTHGTAITVNAVVPSIMDTPANRADMPTAPHEKWPKVDEVAQVYVFLASPESALISGASLPVYGLV
jgi:NAD(P)-dependent dehydrogenase (short-subunit alcohol dehydrogenase family)